LIDGSDNAAPGYPLQFIGAWLGEHWIRLQNNRKFGLNTHGKSLAIAFGTSKKGVLKMVSLSSVS
jgi:hypothetical protein